MKEEVNCEITDQTSHPLEGVDPWVCYDQHISERNKLISAKRDAEDGFIKTIVQLSTTVVLAVPGVMALDKDHIREPSIILMSGIGFVALSLLAALCEQFLSSLAYEKQIRKTDSYYKKESDDLNVPAISQVVRICLGIVFVSFVSGITIITFSLLAGPWR